MSHRKTTIVLLAVFTLVVSTLVPGTVRAAQSKGGKAGANMSDKGRTNNNAQWTADPGRGWVRAEERHLLQDEKKGNPKKNLGKRKGKAEKKTH
ncbi:MAG: hypothetical protein OEN50_08885 [Deltaproteobacteria bacterium]|nr:hypothetical protein [Deltaproteobacteria bacterium]